MSFVISPVWPSGKLRRRPVGPIRSALRRGRVPAVELRVRLAIPPEATSDDENASPVACAKTVAADAAVATNDATGDVVVDARVPMTSVQVVSSPRRAAATREAGLPVKRRVSVTVVAVDREAPDVVVTSERAAHVMMADVNACAAVMAPVTA